MSPIRAICATTLAPILNGQGSLSQTLEPTLESLDFDQRALAHQLILGTLRQGPRLERIASQLVNKPLKPKDKDIWALILMGIFQLEFMRTPAHAVIDNTVDAAHSLKKQWAKALINGVLRNYQREHQKIADKLDNDICYHSAFPGWLAKRVKKFWPDQAKQVYFASNQQPPITLRVNPAHNTIDGYFNLLQEEGIDAGVDNKTGFITLKQSMDVRALPGFDKGMVSIQDTAAQFCSELMQLESDHRVLDACAAPGGKTCAMLERVPTLDMTAVDLEANRLKRVEDNLKRLDLTASLIAGDVADTQKWHDGTNYDRILLDAPCSATGVVRRHPDIKYLRRPEDINALADVQLNLLQKLWPLLKADGILLYATCSILPVENEQVIERFLKMTPDAAVSEFTLPIGLPQKHGVQLLPEPSEEDSYGNDGFYYCRLTKMA